MRKMVAAGAVVLSACAASTSGGMDAGSGDQQLEEWTGSFQELRGSNIRGRATVRSTPSGGTVTVNIAGAVPDAQHPWHVHIGECGSNRPIVGAADAYTPLRVSTDGTARMSATLPVPLVPGTEYHVNVHRSRNDLATIFACARLTR